MHFEVCAQKPSVFAETPFSPCSTLPALQRDPLSLYQITSCLILTPHKAFLPHSTESQQAAGDGLSFPQTSPSQNLPVEIAMGADHAGLGSLSRRDHFSLSSGYFYFLFTPPPIIL